MRLGGRLAADGLALGTAPAGAPRPVGHTREYEAIYEELVEAGLDDEARHDPDAIEAVFGKLNTCGG
jgi:hypothetical protein